MLQTASSLIQHDPSGSCGGFSTETCSWQFTVFMQVKAWHQVFESFECFRDADESDLLPFLTGGYQLNRFLFGLVTILKTTISCDQLVERHKSRLHSVLHQLGGLRIKLPLDRVDDCRPLGGPQVGNLKVFFWFEIVPSEV